MRTMYNLNHLKSSILYIKVGLCCQMILVLCKRLQKSMEWKSPTFGIRITSREEWATSSVFRDWPILVFIDETKCALIELG